jgi:hypothetical protein
VTTLSEALTAYRICAQAEGKSPKTVRWVTSIVTYFSDFLGPDRQDIENLTCNDFRQIHHRTPAEAQVPPLSFQQTQSAKNKRPVYRDLCSSNPHLLQLPLPRGDDTQQSDAEGKNA